MKEDYNQAQHRKCQEHKIKNGFTEEEYAKDLKSTFEFIYRKGYELEQISMFLDELKQLVDNRLEIFKN